MTNLPTNPNSTDAQDTQWLDEILTTEMHDVARKAQIDYIAVNHPNGIRHGKSPQLLAEFIKTNVERATAAILAHEAEAVAAGRIDEHNLVFAKSGELDEADFAEWSLERLKELGVNTDEIE